MYVSMCAYVYIYIYMCTNLCILISSFINFLMYVCMYVWMRLDDLYAADCLETSPDFVECEWQKCMYVCMYVHEYVCMHVGMYVCISICLWPPITSLLVQLHKAFLCISMHKHRHRQWHRHRPRHKHDIDNIPDTWRFILFAFCAMRSTTRKHGVSSARCDSSNSKCLDASPSSPSL